MKKGKLDPGCGLNGNGDQSPALSSRKGVYVFWEQLSKLDASESAHVILPYLAQISVCSYVYFRKWL